MSNENQKVGEGADAGTVEDADRFAQSNAGKVDHRVRRALEAEGHALHEEGKLDAEAEARLRAALLQACAGQEAEVAISWLAITSPTGKYADNPEVKAFWKDAG